MTTTKIIERGDIFASPCRVLVNPVNCVGVSGKGLAKEFKRRFPLSVKAYEKDCFNGLVMLGAPVPADFVESGKLIVAFPTKGHWRQPSQLGHIASGLRGLLFLVEDDRREYPSIAFPALGCGLGQLAWRDVLPLLQDSAERLNECGVSVEIYAPLEAP